MYKFQVDKITVSNINGDLNIVPKSVNVIIGPNNSGKSRFLKEIRDYMCCFILLFLFHRE